METECKHGTDTYEENCYQCASEEIDTLTKENERLQEKHSKAEGMLFNKNTKLLHRNVRLSRENTSLTKKVEMLREVLAIIRCISNGVDVGHMPRINYIADNAIASTEKE